MISGMLFYCKVLDDQMVIASLVKDLLNHKKI